MNRPRRTAVAALAIAFIATSTAVAGATSRSHKQFNRTATFPVYENLPAGSDRSQETVAEISDTTEDGKTLVYTDAPGNRIGFVDISRPNAPRGLGVLPIEPRPGEEGEPTSLNVVGNYVLVAVNTSSSFTTPSGRLDVIDLASRKRVRSLDLGGQPDSIAISEDGRRGIVAIENERDEDAPPDDNPDGEEGDLPQAPAGFVNVLNLRGNVDRWTAEPVYLTSSDGNALPAFTKAGIDTPQDPEPEYVSVNDEGKAAVTLQENNGVVIVDLASKRIERVFSAGVASVSRIDTKSDGRIDLKDSITDVPREPDSIDWIDNRYVATANEGDWKGGTRGWSVFDTRTGEVAWDAGNTFERLAVRHGLYNDDRASKKGTEPEGLAVATMNGRRYAFVGSERSNFVAVYDVSRPIKPKFKQILATTNGPEGIKPIGDRGLLAVSSEVDDAEAGIRSTVALYSLGHQDRSSTQFPTIVSENDRSGAPIGWSALGALSAKPGSSRYLYTAADNALRPSRIFTIDTRKSPARIIEQRELTQNGEPVAWDIEAISARPAGGFWVGVEGATGPENSLYRVSSSGAVREHIQLPADIANRLDRFGIEGVSSYTYRGTEIVYVALQRPLRGETGPRIGRYNTETKTWSWFTYPLEQTNTPGDWVGLSELTVIGRDKLAVIERDKQNGPLAKIKRIYTVELKGASADNVPQLRKKLAIDVLPHLRSTNGWTQEKLEGMAINRHGGVYIVTDNDGLDDASGETVFKRVGRIKTRR